MVVSCPMKFRPPLLATDALQEHLHIANFVLVSWCLLICSLAGPLLSVPSTMQSEVWTSIFWVVNAMLGQFLGIMRRCTPSKMADSWVAEFSQEQCWSRNFAGSWDDCLDATRSTDSEDGDQSHSFISDNRDTQSQPGQSSAVWQQVSFYAFWGLTDFLCQLRCHRSVGMILYICCVFVVYGGDSLCSAQQSLDVLDNTSGTYWKEAASAWQKAVIVAQLLIIS